MTDISPPSGADRPMRDAVQPFRIENTDARGQVVFLGDALQEMLSLHTYPSPVLHTLGEFAIVAAMMGSTLKFQGKLTLQAQGDGPVRVLVVDYVSDGSIRAYAQIDDTTYAEKFGALADDDTRLDLPALMGRGHLAITIDQGPDMERYQGVVELSGATVADAALTYFAQSEQTLTVMQVAIQKVAVDGVPTWRGGGIMLQRLPQPGRVQTILTDDALDDWERFAVLLNSTQAEELTDPAVMPERLLYRLYHEENVRLLSAKPVQFLCPCSRERSENMLKSLGYTNVHELMEDGKIEVRCEFCNETYLFDQVDLLKIGLVPADLG